MLKNEKFAVIMKEVGVGRRNISTTHIQVSNSHIIVIVYKL